MNLAKTSLPRERQSVFCCGKNYQRWRFKGDAFPDIVRHCEICGQEIVWPEYKGPLGNRKSSLRYYYRRRSRFFDLGLTSHGKQRVNEGGKINFLLTEIDAAAVAIGECYEIIPPQARAVFLRLSRTLAKLRKRIVKK